MAVVVASTSPSRVLVTGASGFVGTHLVPMLLQQSYQVRVVTRDLDHLQHHAWRSQVEVMAGDLFDATICASVVAGVDAVVHLAGLAHVRALVRRLGGDITVASKLGEGSEFRVLLPRTLPQEPSNKAS